ncbi:MAG TPA: hypothetical protein VHE30_25955 [Polyangiaceae bacterium]|nr:hypothetical protein [Polyangiaceae bacterium]
MITRQLRSDTLEATSARRAFFEANPVLADFVKSGRVRFVSKIDDAAYTLDGRPPVTRAQDPSEVPPPAERPARPEPETPREPPPVAARGASAEIAAAALRANAPARETPDTLLGVALRAAAEPEPTTRGVDASEDIAASALAAAGVAS